MNTEKVTTRQGEDPEPSFRYFTVLKSCATLLWMWLALSVALSRRRRGIAPETKAGFDGPSGREDSNTHPEPGGKSPFRTQPESDGGGRPPSAAGSSERAEAAPAPKSSDAPSSDEARDLPSRSSESSSSFGRVKASGAGASRGDRDAGGWRCACEGGFLPPALLKSFGGAEAVLRMGTGQCYHKT